MNTINIRQISEKAWHIISNSDHVTLSELATKLNISIEINALSAGWLMAEDKIHVDTTEKDIVLSPKNRYHPIYFG